MFLFNLDDDLKGNSTYVTMREKMGEEVVMNKGKNTGMVRKIDALGRIVLPIELRRTLGIELADPLEYFVDDSNERLTLRKYRTAECMLCSSMEGLAYFKDYFICSSCINGILGNSSEKERGSKKEVVPSSEAATTFEKKQRRSKDTALRLAKIMEEYPAASQKKWAELLGVSQGRVSQLIHKMNDSARGSSGSGE
jgi:transcriptional pleiotropic regulator of transition state genes